MRRIGRGLLVLGVCVGLIVPVSMALDFGVPGASWLVNVGLAKLTLIASLGIMGAGATFIRLANRKAAARELPRAGVPVDASPRGERIERPVR